MYCGRLLFVLHIFVFQLHCCGVNGPTDWEKVFQNKTLPQTCCPTVSVDEECVDGKAYQKGCLLSLQAALEHNTVLVGGFGVGVACVQVQMHSLVVVY